jgi:MFS family permease
VGYAIGSLFTPSFESAQGRRVIFGFAAWTYPTWILCLLLPGDWPISVASVVNGAAAGLLWTTQGNWIASVSSAQPQRAGFNSGLFMLLYSASTVIGQAAALIAFDCAGLESVESPSLVWGMAAASALGMLMLVATPVRWLGSELGSGTARYLDVEQAGELIENSSSSSSSSSSAGQTYPIVTDTPEPEIEASLEPDIEAPSSRPNLRRLARLWKCCGSGHRSRWPLLLGAIALYSLANPIAWVAMPVLIGEDRRRELSISFLVFSTVSLAGYFGSGYALDRLPRRWLFAGSTLLTLGPVLLVLALDTASKLWQYALMMAALAIGITMTNTTLTRAESTDLGLAVPTDGFAMQNFVYCILYALSALLVSAGSLGIQVLAWCTLGALLLAVALLWRFYSPRL